MKRMNYLCRVNSKLLVSSNYEELQLKKGGYSNRLSFF